VSSVRIIEGQLRISAGKCADTGPWDALDGDGRVHDAIQKGFRRGDGLWDWVWQAVHEGGGGV
jgi:hypothetical protein